MSALTLKMFGRMFTGDVSVKNVSGPIQIAEAAGFTASIGVAAFLSFLALVSVSLAGQKLGLTFLILLMGLAFYNDLSRYFG